MSIMYVCDCCKDNSPESCGQFDRTNIRVLPTGYWVCESCFDDMTDSDAGYDGDTAEKPAWDALPPAPTYVPLTDPRNDGVSLQSKPEG